MSQHFKHPDSTNNLAYNKTETYPICNEFGHNHIGLQSQLEDKGQDDKDCWNEVHDNHFALLFADGPFGEDVTHELGEGQHNEDGALASDCVWGEGVDCVFVAQQSYRDC